MSEIIENITFDELSLGQSASLSRTLQAADIAAFAAVSHDTNPAHLDAAYAEQTMFKGVIGHGMWTAGVVSALLGTRFPGAGTIYLGQTLQFRRPVRPQDTITVTLTVAGKNEENKQVELDCLVVNQNGEKVLTGKATILAPTQKISRPACAVPQIELLS
ncbi:MAG: MaoC/PaaZ C-terminal domain-containing protein [Neisseria sp.]|nr:MaoC/PaaZ C-terminal domain-containing protein [Neisseria sp.]